MVATFPEFQRQLVVFAIFPGNLFQYRMLDTKGLIGGDTKAGHATDILFVTKGFETAEHLVEFCGHRTFHFITLRMLSRKRERGRSMLRPYEKLNGQQDRRPFSSPRFG